MKKTVQFDMEVLESGSELQTGDNALLGMARAATKNAYAPYSKFHVGAAALMENGEVIQGTNQENASYPVGICAERTLLSVASSLYPNMPITTLAISYHNINDGGHSDHPISPCGICRQTLLEFEARTGKPMRIILSGMEGKVIVINTARHLLPLSFTSGDMK